VAFKVSTIGRIAAKWLATVTININSFPLMSKIDWDLTNRMGFFASLLGRLAGDTAVNLVNPLTLNRKGLLRRGSLCSRVYLKMFSRFSYFSIGLDGRIKYEILGKLIGIRKLSIAFLCKPKTIGGTY
jgi:hypothetical protein